jgi:trehalose 6-phosphate synthase
MASFVPPPSAVYQFLRAADVCYVGSLHDGMNLVASTWLVMHEIEHGKHPHDL